jgi:hypothetical protein
LATDHTPEAATRFQACGRVGEIAARINRHPPTPQTLPSGAGICNIPANPDRLELEHTTHMTQALAKRTLIQAARTIRDEDRIDAGLVDPFLTHRFQETSPFGKLMLKAAAWISFFFASVLVVFPEVGEKLIEILPAIFYLPERIATALDFIWGLVGEKVDQRHLMYHVPNIIIYAFGIAGVRTLWRRLNKNNWKDLVAAAQAKLEQDIAAGTARLRFSPGFSVLFAGDGDQVAKSLAVDDPLIGPTLSTLRPAYSTLWGRFDVAQGDEGFRTALGRFNAAEAGEYVLFPVVDEHLFLPGPDDLAPHRVEIAVRRIREFERESGWSPKRIIIVGDKEQRSRFVTTDGSSCFASPTDEISLRNISTQYDNVVVADPTDMTLQRIIDIADGRRILFRASDHGAEKYCAAFYRRLSLLGYHPSRDATLTVGYDISDLETEHQVLAQGNSEYLPVIISRDVFDALSKRYLREGAHIFVPHLVKQELQKLVA